VSQNIADSLFRVDHEYMDTWAVTDAVTIAVRSDVMFGAALAAVGGAYALGAAVNRRAVDPVLSWPQALVGGVQDEARVIGRSFRGVRKASPLADHTDGIENRSQNQARFAATLVTVAFLGLAGALALTLSGHPPSPLASLVPAILAASLAVGTALHISRRLKTRSILMSRGARLLASSLFAEASAATAMLVAVSVVVHTAGLTAVSLVEVAAITLAARLAVVLTPWPGGLVTADAIFLIPLIWIGVPLQVGLSAVLIWRAGSLLAGTAAVTTAAFTEFLPHRSLGAIEVDNGRLAHRVLFKALSVLPRGIRSVMRRKVFDAMFSLTDDPWSYQQSDYESRKRQILVSAVSPECRSIVEVGCADGHNVVALAEQLPDAMIIGLDVSATAVAISTQRTRKFDNVQILNTEKIHELNMRSRGEIDCVIFAEILYYLGTERAIRETLRPLRAFMSKDCRVILLHGSIDADSLHEHAVRALDLSVASTQHVHDSERPFVITIARL
jgi:hypothetical protein